jgi:hypothetical protein
MPAASSATAGAPAKSNTQQQAPQPAPFRVGTQNIINQDGYVQTTTFTTTSAAVQLPVYNPSANSFLRGIWIQSQGTVTGQSTNVVVFNADGPFAVYSTISFNDTQGKPIILVDGYELMLINKFGGYHNLGDPRSSGAAYFTTGAGSTGGSWQFFLYIPLELVSRDGIGSLVNKNAASPFQLTITVANGSTAYSSSSAGNAVYGAVAPSTNSTTVVTTCMEDGWWQPKAADSNGQPLSQNPPAPGTTQYWLKTTYNMAAGSNQVQLSGGLGYAIRNILFENYGVATVDRASGQTQFPDPCELLYKGTIMLNIGKQFWLDKMSRAYALFGNGYSTATAPLFDSTAVPTITPALNVLEAGVFVLPFNMDFDLVPGAELRRGYLVTQQGDQFQMIGSYTLACTLTELVNYVASPSGNAAQLRSTH